MQKEDKKCGKIIPAFFASKICCKKVKGSKSVLELPSGYATKLGFNSKDRLEVV